MSSSASTPRPGIVKTWPRILLRLEGAAILGSTIWAYSRLNRSWWTFAGLLLVPDLGMAGYAANTRLGAAFYNAFHTETPAILLLCAGLAQKHATATGLGLVWLAHIGLDRMCGFGLKYEEGFGVTHLGEIGNQDEKKA